jgi:hypothetical protein
MVSFFSIPENSSSSRLASCFTNQVKNGDDADSIREARKERFFNCFSFTRMGDLFRRSEQLYYNLTAFILL